MALESCLIAIAKSKVRILAFGARAFRDTTAARLSEHAMVVFCQCIVRVSGFFTRARVQLVKAGKEVESSHALAARWARTWLVLEICREASFTEGVLFECVSAHDDCAGRSIDAPHLVKHISAIGKDSKQMGQRKRGSMLSLVVSVLRARFISKRNGGSIGHSPKHVCRPTSLRH